jgi:hypothetical protein
MPLSGIAIAEIGVGGLLVWSGIKDYTLAQTFKDLASGTFPATSGTAEPISQDTYGTAADSSATASTTGTSSTAASQSAAFNATGSTSAQQALNNAAAAYGWNTGAEWSALTNIEMREAGFNASATNPSSGAYGLGQALGHGSGAATQGTVTNEYGGYGVSDAVAQAANSGDAEAQAIWMTAYIKVVYGDPIAAWAHEQSAGWY